MLWHAWTFLAQSMPERSSMPGTVREFWRYAYDAWRPAHLPQAAALPAPRGACPEARRV
jgi:hypothetical protein